MYLRFVDEQKGIDKDHEKSENNGMYKDTLTEYIAYRGIEYYDERNHGGPIWIFGGFELLDSIKRIEEVFNITFRFKKMAP